MVNGLARHSKHVRVMWRWCCSSKHYHCIGALQVQCHVCILHGGCWLGSSLYKKLHPLGGGGGGETGLPQRSVSCWVLATARGLPAFPVLEPSFQPVRCVSSPPPSSPLTTSKLTSLPPLLLLVASLQSPPPAIHGWGVCWPQSPLHTCT